MLDRPLVLVAALRTLLADWEHSLPTEGVLPSAERTIKELSS
jgi:hypothetical protein